MDRCDLCMNLQTDEYGDSWCPYTSSIDEDEMYAMLNRKEAPCPFFEPGDEYKIVRKQN